MTHMMAAPMSIPVRVPAGPAAGRKVVPGMTKEPHPTAHPNDSPHTASGERYRSSP